MKRRGERYSLSKQTLLLVRSTAPLNPSFVSYGTRWLVVPADSPDEAEVYAEDYFSGQLPDQDAAEEEAEAMRTIALIEGFEFAKILLLGG